MGCGKSWAADEEESKAVKIAKAKAERFVDVLRGDSQPEDSHWEGHLVEALKAAELLSNQFKSFKKEMKNERLLGETHHQFEQLKETVGILDTHLSDLGFYGQMIQYLPDYDLEDK